MGILPTLLIKQVALRVVLVDFLLLLLTSNVSAHRRRELSQL